MDRYTATYRVVWIRHRVEGTHSQRILVQNVEVGVVLNQQLQHALHQRTTIADISD